MNENEMKMIKEMAEMLIDAQDKCELNPCDECEHRGCREGCWHYLSATELYKKGGRIVADDEIVIKKSEYEELKTHIEDLQVKLGAVMLCIKNTHEIDISDLLEKQKRATAREIFYKLKETLIINNEENTEWFDYDFTLETINELAKAYGIELEDRHER